jgi:hypothetical protein
VISRNTSPIKRRVATKKKRSTPRRSSAVKDPQYREWVSLWPCLLCYPKNWELALRGESVKILRYIQRDYYQRSECAHLGATNSVRGLSQKYSDLESGPLCTKHHREGKESHHAGTKTFWERNAWLDRDALFVFLRALYREECGDGR